MSRNGEDARDLVAALLSNVRTLQRGASRLHGDIDRLHGKIRATHRVVDRLHRKIEGTHARIRVIRSQDRLGRRKKSGSESLEGRKSAVESN